MRKTPQSPATARSRGAILLEAMLALAIFIMAALAVLAIVDRAMSSLHAVRSTERAALLARSAMAQIEAGVYLPQALNGPVGATTADEEGAGIARGGEGWELEVDTEPSSVRGLTLVHVTAIRRTPGSEERVAASYTLSQLVRLSATSVAERGRP